jgi:hypothetical protein
VRRLFLLNEFGSEGWGMNIKIENRIESRSGFGIGGKVGVFIIRFWIVPLVQCYDCHEGM